MASDSKRRFKRNSNAEVDWLAKGTALIKLERHKEALAALEQATSSEPNKGITWYHKGLVLFKLERYEEAVIAIDRFMKLNPESIFLIYAKDTRNEAIKKLINMKKATIIWDDAGECLNRSVELIGLGQYKEALVAVSKAVDCAVPDGKKHYKIVISPWPIWSDGRLGYIRDMTYAEIATADDLSILEKSLRTIDKLLEIDPKDAKAWYARGNALAYMKRYQEAIVALDKAIELDPDNDHASRLKGQIARKSIQ